MICVFFWPSPAQAAEAFQQHAELSAGEVSAVPAIQCVTCHGTVEEAPAALLQSKAGDQTASKSSRDEQQQASVKAFFKNHIYLQETDLMFRSHTGRELSITILNRRFRENNWSTELASEVKSGAFHRNMECMDCHVDWDLPVMDATNNMRNLLVSRAFEIR